MTPQDEREAIARVIDPRAFSEPFLDYLATRRRDALAKADAILALRQPGADYRRGVEDAVRVVDRSAAYFRDFAVANGATEDGALAAQIACEDAATFIRLLPESTKGEVRG